MNEYDFIVFIICKYYLCLILILFMFAFFFILISLLMNYDVNIHCFVTISGKTVVNLIV